MNDLFKKIILIILLPAISWLFFNSVYYRHLHQSTTGFAISHAHPFSKSADNATNSPFASHKHQKSEFVLYDVISNSILPTLVAVFISLLVFDRLIIEYIISEEKLQNQELYLLQKYRGPPSIF
ncbi:hypothetical protein ACFLS4_02440 [Bacteroidota bacterium]